MVPAAYVANSVPAEVSTSVRDATTTLAPCPAKPRHIARPMPRLPPVTSATLSRNVIATPCAGATPTLPCKHSTPSGRWRASVPRHLGTSHCCKVPILISYVHRFFLFAIPELCSLAYERHDLDGRGPWTPRF